MAQNVFYLGDCSSALEQSVYSAGFGWGVNVSQMKKVDGGVQVSQSHAGFLTTSSSTK